MILSILTTLALTFNTDTLFIRKSIFDVWYSEALEQPVQLTYRSINRPKHVDRAGLDFYVEPNVHTSDDDDYYKNEWDKGHLAPAGTFSDTRENLKQTFTYLNSMLQQQELNRGEWMRLEQQERVWDDVGNLTITIYVIFSPTSKKLATGATIPDGFHKHITFESTGTMICYYFPNSKPTKRWTDYQEASCVH